jgi:hypothetical protein
MSWRAHFKAQKAGGTPTLNMGATVAPAGVAYTPTTALGWRDHFMDQSKAKADDATAQTVAAHLTDDPDHQAQIAGAISDYMGTSGQ